MEKRDWTGNSRSIYTTLGASNHTDKEREINDYYATDPIAIDKLLGVEELADCVWECACGEGHLSKKLQDNGYAVYSTDIIDRNGSCDDLIDFLSVEKGYNPFSWDNGLCGGYDIVTNPPFKYAQKFVLKALDMLNDGFKCCMFLKLLFLEGKARYKDLFSKYPPKVVHVFSERIKCAQNGEFEKFPSGAVAYAWFVWEKGYEGQTTIDWI